MIAPIRAGLLKIRSTRTTIGLILAMIALILLCTLLTGLQLGAPGPSQSSPARWAGS
jgi:hypothetical protein